MAMGFDDEFSYLDEEENSNADDAFAPKIKGASKTENIKGYCTWRLSDNNHKLVYTFPQAIDLAKHKVTKSIAVGRYPWGVAVKP